MTQRSRRTYERPARPGDSRFQFRTTVAAGAVPGRTSRRLVATSRNSRLPVPMLDDHHSAMGPGTRTSRLADCNLGLRHMMLTPPSLIVMQRMQRAGPPLLPEVHRRRPSRRRAIALRPAIAVPVVRNQGFMSCRGAALTDLMWPMPVEPNDIVKGRHAVIILGEGNIFSISGNLGTQYPQASGWAWGGGGGGGGCGGDQESTTLAASWNRESPQRRTAVFTMR